MYFLAQTLSRDGLHVHALQRPIRTPLAGRKKKGLARVLGLANPLNGGCRRGFGGRGHDTVVINIMFYQPLFDSTDWLWYNVLIRFNVLVV
jgi:hypothetical protein